MTPGRRVLSGRIIRGVAERIGAVLWFSDLRGFTRITDEAPPEQIIPLLNDYAEAVISAVHEAGGDVLKLIGDGTLAIFKADDPARACRYALEAEALTRERVAALNARRAAEGLPVTDVYLGLHIGEVFYGNIGSPDRLDFTVVGPAVNEASRIAAMCRSAERGRCSPRRSPRPPARRIAQPSYPWADTRFAASGEPRSYSRSSGRSVVSIAAGEPSGGAATVTNVPIHARASAHAGRRKGRDASAIGRKRSSGALPAVDGSLSVLQVRLCAVALELNLVNPASI